MPFGVPGLRKLPLTLAVLLALGVTSLSCYSSKAYQNPSRTRFRAFISNSLHPVATGHEPAIEIMNADLDQLTFSPIVLSAMPDVGPLDLSADKLFTLAYSPGNNTFAVINNLTEQPTGATSSLPDSTQSFFIAADDKHAYAAVPNAPLAGQTPGAVIQMDLSTGTISATLPIPHARFVAQALSGTRVLAFSDNSGGLCSPESGAVTVIDTTKIGTSMEPRTTLCGLNIGGFDHPVGAAVLNVAASQAFVLECGPECGGTVAGITPIDLNTNTVGARIPVPAATIGLVANSTLFVAGTPPGTPCDASTQATSCGVLTVVDVPTLTVTNPAPILITNGHHSHMELTGDGQIFIGATACDNVNVPPNGGNPAEIRGCLSVLNTTTPASKARFPPINGDITGIAPLTGRNVVYAIQAGELVVYDTTTDLPLPNHQIDIVGQLVDVKAVDNAP
jgi:hypothetical protein